MGTTPYSKIEGSKTGPYYKSITGSKSNPRTNAVLPCETIVALATGLNQYPIGTFMPPFTGVIWQQGTAGHGVWPYGYTREGPRAAAYNRARSRFLDKVSSARAQGLTALAERKSTMEMVNKRLFQLLKAGTALRRGNFQDFLKHLNVRPLDKHRNKGWNRSREAGGLWLEYWFGWAPTVGDIYSLVDAYTNEVNDDYVKAGGSGSGDYNFTGGNGTWKTTTSESYDCYCHIGALVEVSNNDLLDLNEAGLLNPAQTALELIPFSWFAGWFVNLSDVLGSLTDTCGLKFREGWISEKTERDLHHEERRRSDNLLYGERNTYTMRFMRSRFYELPIPTIEWKLPAQLSVTRGATLSALLAQLLPKSGR